VTRFLITDPGTAAHPAKNALAAPGLPNQPLHDYSGRTPMVGSNTQPSPYADVVELLRDRPAADAPLEDRAGWLFRMADALDEGGAADDAAEARDAATELVREAITTLAGGGL
jgi:type VI protein secretion system component VasF